MSGHGAPEIDLTTLNPAETSQLRLAIVAASWHTQIMDGLLDGALRAAKDAGISEPTVLRVPGSFELPVAAARLATALRRRRGARRRDPRRNTALRIRLRGGHVRA